MTDIPDGFTQVGRLSMRQEGGYWNAYYAEPGTMEGALFLGSIRMNLVTGNKERKDAFMTIMRECVEDLIEEVTGLKPGWAGEQQAPEHERSGNA